MKLLITTAWLLSLQLASGNEFVDQFKALKKAGDDAAIIQFLEKAATEEADNPEYYANAGNYWWGAGGAVAVTQLKAGDYKLDPQSFAIVDPKTGKQVGAIGKAGDLDPTLPKKAIEVLSQGAEKFPGRADIALGLAHIQKKLDLKEGYVKTLTALLAQAKKEPDSLEWTLGGKLPSAPETFLPETVQGYSSALFNANTPATDKLCVQLLDSVIDTYPEHPFAYNLKGALADATGKPEEALKMLTLAHEKAPKDSLILANVARAHVKLGQKDKAIATFEKALALEMSPRSRAQAEAELKKLKTAGEKSGPDEGAKDK